MTEFDEARVLANRILDRVNADPDDDLAMLSRQLLRRDELAEDRAIALRLVLDAVDWQAGACRINEMIGAVLPVEILARARKAVEVPVR